jgi:hypothetical protein
VQNFIPQCNQKKIMQNYLKETNSTIKDFTKLILSLFIATCRNVFKANEKEVEKELAEMLKHCPDKQGGPRYKV